MNTPVATTALLVAAIRADESKRADRLFEDPFADVLAGDAGRAALQSYRAAVGASIPIIEVRTRYFDEALLRAQSSGARQFVIVAAGMDARAYRLDWQADTRVFELDQPEIIEAKAAALTGAAPRCDRRAVAVDLAGDWSTALEASGFSRDLPSTWLVEGLLQYLEAKVVESLFAKIHALAAPGSTLLYDIVGESLLQAPPLAATLSYMRELGAPWIFGTDDPGGLVASRGWAPVVTDPSVIGNTWKRWPFPAAPAHVRGIPSGYLIEAHKR
jgi:methyltransferase (TIGR00027 family)